MIQLIKDGVKWLQERKISLGAIITAFVFGFVLCYYIFVLNNNNPEIDIDISSQGGASLSPEKKEQFLQTASGINIIQEEFVESKRKWDTRSYAGPDNQGFYCVRQGSNFSSPDMWYKDVIPTNFKSINVKFEAKNVSKVDILPTFIFSLGKNPEIFRFYIAEKDAQVVGFERSNLTAPEDQSNLLERDVPGRTISAPIKQSIPIELQIIPHLGRGNSANVIFNINYISSINGKTQEDQFSYDFQFPYPNPTDSAYTVNFGLGTIKGGCIKPISYEIHY
ncbi:MAG: hypothetical protein HYS87_02870 [Candidatus Colwellbacteria bacterium]|nr:hypothetical protein [Candidatus Colwellbacteria bacterium]